MGDGNFDDCAASHLKLPDKFEADSAAGGSQLYTGEQISTDQPEIAVDVSEFDTKQRAGKAVVDPSDRCPMPRVLTLNFVPVNKPCIRTCRVQEQIEFTWIVLTVAISVEDPILGRRFEAAAKYRSVAQIHCMRNHMESISILLPQLRQHVCSIIDAAVVDDYHLVIRNPAPEDVKYVGD